MYNEKSDRIIFYIPVIASALMLAVSCSTTTISTGPTYRINNGKNSIPLENLEADSDEEESFFNALNDKNKVKPVSVQTGDESLAEKNSNVEGIEDQNVTYAPEKKRAKIRERSAEIDPVSLEDAEEPEQTAKGGDMESDAAITSFNVPAVDRDEFDEVGTASWYGRDFNGQKTANGDTFDSSKLTAAHKELPLGSIVLVRNLENGKEVLVKVNDRGPYVSGRIMDLSEYGAEVIGYKSKGLATVGIKIVRRGNGTEKNQGITAAYYGKNSLKGGEGKKINGDDYILSPGRKITESSANVVQEGTITGFSVQVGVFGDLKNAVGMQKLLSTFGDPVHIVKKDDVYVVRVGDYKTKYQAEKMKYELVSNGYTGFIYEPSSGNY